MLRREEPTHKVVVLWPRGAPLAQGAEDVDIPKLTIYLQQSNPASAAVLILPGGGDSFLASDHEGKQPAEWLNHLGFAAFVMQYRLGSKYHYPAQLLDAQRALRYVPANAASFGVDPARIGVWGFSAEWSFQQLLGGHSSAELVKSVSTDFQVTPDTPPNFLMLANDDDGVSPENSIRFYSALCRMAFPRRCIFTPRVDTSSAWRRWIPFFQLGPSVSRTGCVRTHGQRKLPDDSLADFLARTFTPDQLALRKLSRQVFISNLPR